MEEIIKQLDALNGDNEVDHARADELLLEALRKLGAGSVADSCEAARERIGFWYA